MKPKTLTAAVIALTALASQGHTQAKAAASPPAASNAASPTVAADPSRPHRLELAKRYFSAVNVDGLTRQMMDNMLPAMMAQQEKQMAAIPPEMRSALLSSMQESMAALFPRMMDQMGALYADSFTELELQKLVDFYESPDGRRITAKNGQVVAKSGPLMSEMMS